MKKICVITTSHWTAGTGGAQYQAHCLMDELVKRDCYELYYFARNFDPAYQPKGYKLKQISSPGKLAGGRMTMVYNAWSLMRLLRQIEPDVIYQRALRSYTSVAAYFAKRHGKRFVFHVASDHDVQPLVKRGALLTTSVTNLERAAGGYGLRNAGAIVVQSRCQAALLKRYYGRTQTSLVRNFHPSPQETIEKRLPIKIVWVGNFKPVKRPEMFVQLARELQERRDLRFIMIGRDGGARHYGALHATIAGLSNLRYLGEQPIDRVNRVLAESHILVNTSLTEGFPNTFIQAWMRRVPVVSVSVNVDDILDGNTTGFRAGSYDAMRDIVIRLVSNMKLREDIGARAQAYARVHCSTANVERLLAVMDPDKQRLAGVSAS